MYTIPTDIAHRIKVSSFQLMYVIPGAYHGHRIVIFISSKLAFYLSKTSPSVCNVGGYLYVVKRLKSLRGYIYIKSFEIFMFQYGNYKVENRIPIIMII